MSQWRLFLAALSFVVRFPSMSLDRDPHGADLPHAATRYIPLIGIFLGCVAASAYWLAAQLWPTNVAVMMSLLAATTLCGDRESFKARYWVFLLLIQYNALMALSAANVPVPLPAYVTLGLIMIAGHAASRALVVSVMATDVRTALRVTNNDLSVALLVGLAPAALLGIPGLIGLVSAIVARLGLTAYVLPRLKSGYREHLVITQHVTEVCFYLGALATWKYV
jgi:hypothetical protein